MKTILELELSKKQMADKVTTDVSDTYSVVRAAHPRPTPPLQ